ncbi:MAG: hypothetical protein ABIK61_06115 [candidate division WOR-3 bacterium]
MIFCLIQFINILPLPFAIAFSQLFVLTYLLLKPQYRKEIYYNYINIIGKDDKFFWIKNALGVGKNLGLMIKANRKILNDIEVRNEDVLQKIKQNFSVETLENIKINIKDIADKSLDNVKFNRENIINNIMKNNSCIVVSFHFGPWELLPKIFGQKGYQILLSVQNQRNQRLNNYLVKYRCDNKNIHLVYDLKSLNAKLTNSLQPLILGFVLDNMNTASGFQILTNISDAIKNNMPLVLCRRYSLPVVPIFIYSEDTRIKVSLGEAIMPNLSQEKIRQNIAQQFLPFLRATPEQWVFWAK